MPWAPGQVLPTVTVDSTAKFAPGQILPTAPAVTERKAPTQIWDTPQARAAISSGLALNDPTEWARRLAAGDPHISIVSKDIDYSGAGRFYAYDGVWVGPPADADTVRQVQESVSHDSDSLFKFVQAFVGVVALAAGVDASGVFEAGSASAGGSGLIGGADVGGVAAGADVAAAAGGDLVAEAGLSDATVAAEVAGGTGASGGLLSTLEKSAASLAVSSLKKKKSTAAASVSDAGGAVAAPPPAAHKSWLVRLGEAVYHLFEGLAHERLT